MLGAGAIASVGDIFKDLWKGRQDRVAAREAAAAKITQAKVDTENDVTLSKQELAKLRLTDMGGSWKDEVLMLWILAFFTMPPVFLLLGMPEAAKIISDFISNHFPPGTIGILIGAVFGISRLTK